MVVWIPEAAGAAAAPGAGVSARQGGVRVSASHSYRHDTLIALIDGILPADSFDRTVPRMTFLNHVGSKEWIVYEFSKERMVDSSRVYWYDDASTGDGFCKPPYSWRLFWRRGEEWAPVKPLRGEFFFKLTNRFNDVKFEPVKTTAIRMELELAAGRSAGMLEWQVLDAN